MNCDDVHFLIHNYANGMVTIHPSLASSKLGLRMDLRDAIFIVTARRLFVFIHGKNIERCEVEK